jgi:POT family proton-dependent oligopeptide transporter
MQGASQTRAFAVLFLIELWERFGYYGAAGLLVLFMTQRLGMPDHQAVLTFGAFSALVFGLPAVGGWIGDRVLGAKRTMLLGAVVLAAGYFVLSLPFEATLFPALGLVAVGNGLFKVNPNHLVSRLYAGRPSRLDGAFTLYYMAVNIGAAASLYLTPEIAQGALLTGLPDQYRWHVAFAFSWIGMGAGLANYMMMRGRLRELGSSRDFAPAGARVYALVLGATVLGALLLSQVIQYTGIAATVVALAGVIVLGVFVRLLATCRAEERGPLAACLVLTVEMMIFFLFYQQMSTSLTLFALRNVEHHLAGLAVPPAQFQVLNPLWIMALSPLLAAAYGRAGARGRDLSIAAKQASGMVLAALAFFVYAGSTRFAAGGVVSAWWLVGGYGLLSASELLISGLGMAMVTRLAPERVRGFTMGAWFLASGIAQYLGSLAASLASVPQGMTDPMQTLPFYFRLFLGLGALAAVAALIAFAALPWLNRLMRGAAQAGAMSPRA